MKPSLVRDTTKANPFQRVGRLVTAPVKSLFGAKTVVGEALDRVILEPGLKVSPSITLCPHQCPSPAFYVDSLLTLPYDDFPYFSYPRIV